MTGEPTRIIKPLYLAQDDSTKLLTHGGQWVDKVRRLRKRDALPEAVLFPVKAPARDTKPYQAFEEIREDLQATGVTVVAANDEESILQVCCHVRFRSVRGFIDTLLDAAYADPIALRPDSKKANPFRLAFLLADQRPAGIRCGAGDGNRTHGSSLGS